MNVSERDKWKDSTDIDEGKWEGESRENERVRNKHTERGRIKRW